MLKIVSKTALLATLGTLLAACASTANDDVVQAGAKAGVCVPDQAQTLVGQSAQLSDLVIKEKTGAKLIRRVTEGSPVTMDYNAARITISHKDGVITSSICG